MCIIRCVCINRICEHGRDFVREEIFSLIFLLTVSRTLSLASNIFCHTITLECFNSGKMRIPIIVSWLFFIVWDFAGEPLGGRVAACDVLNAWMRYGHGPFNRRLPSEQVGYPERAFDSDWKTMNTFLPMNLGWWATFIQLGIPLRLKSGGTNQGCGILGVRVPKRAAEKSMYTYFSGDWRRNRSIRAGTLIDFYW